jgi:diadenosine tetraphosphate (Ap4A) HIT family hydrolase
MDSCDTCTSIEDKGIQNIILENDAAIAQVVDFFREGHCCVITKKHRGSISQLTESEYKGVFDLIVKTSKALEAKYNAEKTYLLVIGDSSPVDHLHFHLIPKHRAKCSMGVYCFGKLFESEGRRNTSEPEKDQIAKELREHI